MATDFTSITKTLYDLHKAQEPGHYTGSPLAQLVVENFDEEQIWQELELQNKAVLKHFKNTIDEALADETLTVLEEEEQEESGQEEEEGASADNDDDEEEEEEEQELEPPRRTKKMAVEEDDNTEDDSDLDFDVDALEKKEKQKKDTGRKASKAKVVPSEVDDKFFKLSEMEAFLDDMDKCEGKEDEDDVDYFQDLPSDEDDDLDLEQIISTKKQKKNTVCNLSHIFHSFFLPPNSSNYSKYVDCSLYRQVKSSRNLKYKDFFDAVDSEPAKTDDPSDGEDDSVDESQEEGEEVIDDDYDGEEEGDDE